MKIGSRVHRVNGSQHGIIRELNRTTALVYWGLIDRKESTSWVPVEQLEEVTEQVLQPDEVIARQAEEAGGKFKEEDDG